MKTATAPLPPLRSVRFWTSCVSAYATCSLQPNLCPLGSCLHPFHGASPGNLGQQRSRGISVPWLANERFGLHASSGIGGLAVLLRQGAVHGSAPLQEIGRPRPSLAGGADPG